MSLLQSDNWIETPRIVGRGTVSEDAFGRYLADGSEPSVTRVMTGANAIRNPSENGGNDAYDACPKHERSKVQHDGWEAEI